MVDKEQQIIQRKGEQLHSLENKLKELHRGEIKNRFEIGRVLNLIKERKLYYYKDSQGNYTWDFWCNEFYGSRRTAERYIDLWFIFINFYKYKMGELEDIPYTKLIVALPLLKSGEAKTRDEVDKIVEMARTIPSEGELKKALYQKDLPLADLQNCEHIIEFYAQCKVCSERRKISRNNINNVEEIEAKFL